MSNEFSDYIEITKNSNESIKLDQRRVKIRENEKGLMGISYVAPVFEAMDLEEFFKDLISSEKLTMNIGETGDFTVAFRGIVDGKGGVIPQNLDHKIILLQGRSFLDPRMKVQQTGFSRFIMADERLH